MSPLFCEAAAATAEGGLAFGLCFLFIFNDFCHINYFNAYRTDLRRISRGDRNVAVDERCELVFRTLKGRCHGNQLLLAYYY